MRVCNTFRPHSLSHLFLSSFHPSSWYHIFFGFVFVLRPTEFNQDHHVGMDVELYDWLTTQHNDSSSTSIHQLPTAPQKEAGKLNDFTISQQFQALRTKYMSIWGTFIQTMTLWDVVYIVKWCQLWTHAVGFKSYTLAIWPWTDTLLFFASVLIHSNDKFSTAWNNS